MLLRLSLVVEDLPRMLLDARTQEVPNHTLPEDLSPLPCLASAVFSYHSREDDSVVGHTQAVHYKTQRPLRDTDPTPLSWWSLDLMPCSPV